MSPNPAQNEHAQKHFWVSETVHIHPFFDFGFPPLHWSILSTQKSHILKCFSQQNVFKNAGVGPRHRFPALSQSPGGICLSPHVQNRTAFTTFMSDVITSCELLTIHYCHCTCAKWGPFVVKPHVTLKTQSSSLYYYIINMILWQIKSPTLSLILNPRPPTEPSTSLLRTKSEIDEESEEEKKEVWKMSPLKKQNIWFVAWFLFWSFIWRIQVKGWGLKKELELTFGPRPIGFKHLKFTCNYSLRIKAASMVLI